MFDEDFVDENEDRILDSFESIIDNIESEICGTIFDDRSRQNIEQKLIEISSIHDYHDYDELIDQFYEQSNEVTFTNFL